METPNDCLGIEGVCPRWVYWDCELRFLSTCVRIDLIRVIGELASQIDLRSQIMSSVASWDPNPTRTTGSDRAYDSWLKFDLIISTILTTVVLENIFLRPDFDETDV